MRISDWSSDVCSSDLDGMVGTMYDPRGTGRATAVGAPYRMAGKTGTAQRVSRKGNVSTNPHLLPLHLRHQAWFIGYAPAQDPGIAVAVMVEHGGYGGSTAAPIARKLFDAWLLGEYAEPDPDAIPVTAIGVRAEPAEASPTPLRAARAAIPGLDRSEEHTSELQSLMRISYAVFCLKKHTTCRHNKHSKNKKS